MDLSKAFDSINHNFLVSKLKAYGFSGIALQFIKSYLKNRKQKVNLNNTFSEWKTILNDVLQGSILGNLLLTIFLNGFFLLASHSYLRNYPDGNTLYCFSNNISDEARKQKSVWSNVFWYVKVSILWKCVQYTIHWDKTNMFFPSDKINGTKNVLFLFTSSNSLQFYV